MEREIAGDGLSGALIVSPFHLHAIAHPRPSMSGNHHVPPVAADTRLDGSRDRDAAQPGIRAQFHLAERAEPFHGQVMGASYLWQRGRRRGGSCTVYLFISHRVGNRMYLGARA